jgi:hypothetical protein
MLVSSASKASSCNDSSAWTTNVNNVFLCQQSPDNFCSRQQPHHMVCLGAVSSVAELHHDGTIQSTWKEAHLAQQTDQCSTK